jgi:hypothetical protein
VTTATTTDRLPIVLEVNVGLVHLGVCMVVVAGGLRIGHLNFIFLLRFRKKEHTMCWLCSSRERECERSPTALNPNELD